MGGKENFPSLLVSYCTVQPRASAKRGTFRRSASGLTRTVPLAIARAWRIQGVA